MGSKPDSAGVVGTTSRITSSPARCSSRTMVLNSVTASLRPVARFRAKKAMGLLNSVVVSSQLLEPGLRT